MWRESDSPEHPIFKHRNTDTTAGSLLDVVVSPCLSGKMIYKYMKGLTYLMIDINRSHTKNSLSLTVSYCTLTLTYEGFYLKKKSDVYTPGSLMPK